MAWPDVFLLCFALGSLWAVASVALGGLRFLHFGHIGHGGGLHAHHHAGKFHAGHHLTGHIVNPSCIAVFLAWFGGVGYVLLRHSTMHLWADLCIASAIGVLGAAVLARFLALLDANDRAMNPADYDMVGTLGRVTATIRPDGVGEISFVRDGARRASPARSEDQITIEKGAEVMVLRHVKGIVYVRTWDAMTQHAAALDQPR